MNHWNWWLLFKSSFFGICYNEYPQYGKGLAFTGKLNFGLILWNVLKEVLYIYTFLYIHKRMLTCITQKNSRNALFIVLQSSCGHILLTSTAAWCLRSSSALPRSVQSEKLVSLVSISDLIPWWYFNRSSTDETSLTWGKIVGKEAGYWL